MAIDEPMQSHIHQEHVRRCRLEIKLAKSHKPMKCPSIFNMCEINFYQKNIKVTSSQMPSRQPMIPETSECHHRPIVSKYSAHFQAPSIAAASSAKVEKIAGAASQLILPHVVQL
jgi:hypothetical protein